MSKRISARTSRFRKEHKAISQPAGAKRQEEYRLFRLSSFALETERAVKSRRGMDDPAGCRIDPVVSLVLEAESLLRANQELWKHVDPETTIPGLSFLAASASLDRARALLMDAADLCGHWQAVEFPSSPDHAACTD